MNNKELDIIFDAEIFGGNQEKGYKDFCKSLKRLSSIKGNDQIFQGIIQYREKTNETIPTEPDYDSLKRVSYIHYLLDLVEQGAVYKKLKKQDGLCLVTSPDKNNFDSYRRILTLRRDDQLRVHSVKDFVKNLQKFRLYNNSWYSIHSLMRDGRELKEKLFKINNITDEDERKSSLDDVIIPYIQFIKDDEICEVTGIKLLNIWRYFRHTWTVPYKSVPGRSMMILIRDAATENHTVIGIAGLCSATAQFEARDKSIGWHQDILVKGYKDENDKWVEPKIKANPDKYLPWMNSSLQKLIDDIYKKDFFRDNIINHIDLKYPTVNIVTTLRELSEKYAAQHKIFHYQKLDNYYKNTEDANWLFEAETYLFKSKRALQLSKLLNIKIIFLNYEILGNDSEKLIKAFESTEFKEKLETLVRMIKAVQVGIGLMDINVCGAIAPYNEIFGGKLVSMLLCSPEIVKAYYKRYKNQPSIIASSMQGKRVFKVPRLLALGTQSLYSKFNQYTRVSIPPEELGDPVTFNKTGQRNRIKYNHVGTSKGFGSFQFSPSSTKAMSDLVKNKAGGRIVNFRFGEGANPNFRQHREALENLGFNSDLILKHNNPRQFYLVPLVKNLDDALLEIDSKIEYYISLENTKIKTNLIYKYWAKRWLLPRLNNNVLEKLSNHTLVYPIEHGAQIRFPKDMEDDQLELELDW